MADDLPPFVVPNVKKIRDVNLPGTPWDTSASCGMTFTFTNTPPIMIINRIYENQYLLSL